MLMKKSRLIFYILLFLIGFAPFLPVPYAPAFLHEFFSGIGSILFVPIFLLLICCTFIFLIESYFTKKFKSILLEALTVPVLFLLLVFLTPTFDDWRNRATIWLNDGREVGNFVNPFLGMKLVDCRGVNRDYDAFFKHNGASIEFSMLEYAPKRPVPLLHREGNRMLYGDGIREVYKENWYLSGSGSQYSQEWANCLTDERQ